MLSDDVDSVGENVFVELASARNRGGLEKTFAFTAERERMLAALCAAVKVIVESIHVALHVLTMRSSLISPRRSVFELIERFARIS